MDCFIYLAESYVRAAVKEVFTSSYNALYGFDGICKPPLIQTIANELGKTKHLVLLQDVLNAMTAGLAFAGALSNEIASGLFR